MRDFIIGHEDWSLHRKGEIDQQRHCEKVREAIRRNLPEIISEESIILSNGREVVKVPIRSLEEYRFRFDERKRLHVGQGNGRTRVGDVVGGIKGCVGRGRGAGSEPGTDYYETEVTVDELAELVLEELGLPHLREKTRAGTATAGIAFRDVRKKGITANLDRRRTIMEAIKKNALRGRPGLYNIAPEDLRFKTWEVVEEPQAGAVVLAMMDTSGSMGPFEKYIARTFFFWMTRFLHARYRGVEIVFLAHHTEARETSEEEFFSRGESGGTRCSSVYRLALDIIRERYPGGLYNIYAFHFSDGDNLLSDNDLCVQYVRELLQMANLVGYGEIEGPYYYTSTLRTALQRIVHPRFVTVVLRDKGDVFHALKTFFGREKG
ncbi:MAG: sporulation protein YhbH [Bacillota bacterium]